MGMGMGRECLEVRQARAPADRRVLPQRMYCRLEWGQLTGIPLLHLHWQRALGLQMR